MPDILLLAPKGTNRLNDLDVYNRYIRLSLKLLTGLHRIGKPTTADGGMLAFRTNVPPMTSGIWKNVKAGKKAIASDVAGTNWTVNVATKELDGSISIDPRSKQTYEIKDRQVPFADFIERIATPIARAIENEDISQPMDIGISLGFPHKNSMSSDGIHARFQGKILPKEWKIIDWDTNTPSVTQALRDILEKKHHSNVGTLVAVNDTVAVALDGGAIQSANESGLKVVPAGFVGGSGTNGAIDHTGLVNTEIGQVEWDSDDVYNRMRKNDWITNTPVLEHEAGMYLPLRLAATLQILEEKSEIPKGHNTLVKELISNNPIRDQKLISKLASGETQSDNDVQVLAKTILERAGQVYGIALATLAQSLGKPKDAKTIRGFLVEGSVLLDGYGVRDTAEQTAADLGLPVTLIDASGLKGVATLAMAFPYLTQH